MEEVWKDIDGYKGYYQVSNLGNIKSLTREIHHLKDGIHIRKGKLLSKKTNKYGYVSASLSKESRMKSFSIHRLVAEAFIPNPENKPQVNHKNGIKSDNTVGNLEWNTSSENLKHAFKLGVRCVKGEKGPSSKLTELQAREIKYLHSELKTSEIGRMYNVHRITVSDILSGKTWKHI